ncbi:uncharacterized protein [Aegilops tauschii subsp. strangulata]|uniref:uncharacterized protein n=1 Tax=Aegilops tauschii subsp. strangulata TaxID=200361 RepID=UPI003CC8D68F
MDGGSGLNNLYAETLRGMGIPMSKLSESSMRFHRVIPGKKADSLAEWIEQQQPTQVHSEHWTMFFDGSMMLNGSGAGVVLVSPRGDKLSYVLQIHFDSSNNEGEYEALLYGVHMAISLGVRRLMVYGDSDLAVNQGLKNQAADDLAKLGSTRKPIPRNVFLEHLHTLSIQEDPFTEEPLQPISSTNPTEIEVPAVVDLIMEVLVITPDWTVPYIAYLLRQELPEDEDEARQIVRRSKAFTVISGQLYRESVTGVAEHCISPEEVNKFTKWIEVKSIKNLDSSTAISFIRELIFLYGVPHSIITDNVSNFDSDEFTAFCASQGTRVDYASVAHPQSNGQAERANGLILQGLKPRLMRNLKHAARAWVNELPSVLWGLRMTPNRSTNRTPFFMVYGAEAVLPSDLLHNPPRVELFSEAEAEQACQDAVDLLEEE